MRPSCLQPCELAGSAQPAEDTGVCRRVWEKEPQHQSELRRMTRMGPWGQKMGEWWQPHAPNRGGRTPAQHGGETSPSTSVLLYGRHEGGWGHPWGTRKLLQEGSGKPHTPFGEGGMQRMSAGAEHIIQQSFPNLCPLWGLIPTTPKANAPLSPWHSPCTHASSKRTDTRAGCDLQPCRMPWLTAGPSQPD